MFGVVPLDHLVVHQMASDFSGFSISLFYLTQFAMSLAHAVGNLR